MTPHGLRLFAFVLLCYLTSGSAEAHKPSDSYLKIDANGQTLSGQWDIALRDLDVAIGLDANQDNAITWGEVKAKHKEIAAYALSRLSFGTEGMSCAAEMDAQLIDNHSDGAYSVLRFKTVCPVEPATLDINYRLFFDLDPQHRGLLNFSAGDQNQTGIFSADSPSQRFTLGAPSKLAQFAGYLMDGIRHIWSGFDHILFLLSLLLPAVLLPVATPGRASAGPPGFGAAVREVVKVITAFTVAHSVTLSLATLGVISLPSRLVESAIALSVVLSALNNIFPVVRGGRWIIAFVFGLIHGFGFASVLIDLGLPQTSLLLALVAFNLGVEAGQLAIVAIFLPIAFALGSTVFYRRAVLIGGSSAVAVIAALWFAQRAFDIVLVPGIGS